MITFMKTNLHEAVVVVGDADVYVDIYWSYWAIYGENLVKGYSLQTVDCLLYTSPSPRDRG